MKYLKIVIVLFFSLFGFDSIAQNKTIKIQKITGQEVQKKMLSTDIYKKYSPAVFKILTDNGQGSGFFITPTLAVSNWHVFEGSSVEDILIKMADGTVLYVDEVIEGSYDSDHVVFRVKNYRSKTLIPIELDINTIQVGQTCYAIGSPLGYENTFSQGLISQTKLLKTKHIIQTNAPFDHGSSGGVLLNEHGKAIGITCGGRDDSGANLNFAISIDVLSVNLRNKLREFYQKKKKNTTKVKILK